MTFGRHGNKACLSLKQTNTHIKNKVLELIYKQLNRAVYQGQTKIALQSVVKTLRLLWSFSPKLKVSILLTSPTHFQNTILAVRISMIIQVLICIIFHYLTMR